MKPFHSTLCLINYQWWHELIRALIFAATLLAMTYLLFGIR